ncbi:MAG: peptidase [Kordiimonadaceae bacterium]|nr:peptidase [Kordiimonadaceae bacterium]MBT6036852.1 peptidase [Kordiimonadaceae bacterium]MBT6329143.1 peptidase [Kordiimonadaceae bacterium]
MAGIKTIVGIFIFFISASLTFAQEKEGFEFWPGVSYDSSIPTTMDVLGYDIGDQISSSANIIKYFEALAAAVPDRVRFFDIGKTWEGRRLIYIAVGSAERISALEDLKTGMHQLHDSRITDQAQADQLIKDLPGTIWLGYGIHGDETSSNDAAMMTAYHILAAQNDPIVDNIRQNVVTFINPTSNPDGRDRFVNSFLSAEGMMDEEERISAEHDQPWPGGRTNHYLFDLNRDGFVLTQPETRNQAMALRQYFPLVVMDIHEQGGDGNFYFDPEPAPFNPHDTEVRHNNVMLFAANHARHFDNFGFDYFTREVFDEFFPGYVSTTPSYYGAIGMLFEQPSVRGMTYRRKDGTVAHYRGAVRRQFVGSISVGETVANNREKLLGDFYDYGKSGIEEAENDDIKSFIIPVQKNQAGANKLVGLMAMQDVEIGEATSSFSACRANYPAGSYIINTAQPTKRFIRVLLDKSVPMSDEFIAEEERLHSLGQRSKIYDVTSWSLPLMWGVDVAECSENLTEETVVVAPNLIRPGMVMNADASFAYLVPWGETTASNLLSRALHMGLHVKSSDEKFVNGAQEFPSGTLVFLKHLNEDGLGDKLAMLAQETGASVVGVNDSWIMEGPNFGSSKTPVILPPKVGILWDVPTDPYSTGNTRFVIERQLGYPVTVIRTDQLKSQSIDRFQVLIMPQSRGGYASVLGKAGADNIKNWVERGGTLIALGSALNYLISEDIGLLSSKLELAYNPDQDATGGDNASTRTEGASLDADGYQQAITPENQAPSRLAGFIVKAKVDKNHWMSAGLADEINVVMRRSDIYSPLKLNDGTNVAYMAAADEVLQSGYIYDETKTQLAFKPFVMVEPTGAGNVIAFAYSPTTRAYVDGLNTLLMNAIIRGPAHSRALR